MYRFRSAAATAFGCLLLSILAACGGGGGGGGGSDGGGNPPPGDVGNTWLPTGAGMQWVYNDWIQLAFQVPVERKGRTIHGLVYPTQGREYFVTTADMISLDGLYLPSIQADRVYTGDIHFDTPVRLLGNSWTPYHGEQVTGTGSIDISPTYGKRSLNVSGVVNYEGEEAVDTGIGVFPAKKVSINLTLTTTVDGTTFTLPYSVTYWFAKDVGIARRDQQGTSYRLSAATGLDDADGDGFFGADDKFPQDGTRWEVAPLYASDDGIALTSVPSFNRLEQTVTIMEGNAPASAAWNAMSDQSWLTATPQAGSQLRVAADPTGLAPDTLHYATVTISSNGSDVSATPATIRVALWVGSQDAASAVTLNAYPVSMVPDPLRPYVYLAEGFNIQIYNVYTQALVDSIPLDPASGLTGGDLLVSSDGSYLYAQTHNKLKKIALDAPYGQVDIMSGVIGSYALARPQGHQLLLDHSGYIYHANSGARIGSAYWYAVFMDGVLPSVSMAGNRGCTGIWFPQISLACYQFSYASTATPTVRSKSIGRKVLDLPYAGVAIGNSGEDVYATINGKIRRYRIEDMQQLGEGSAQAHMAMVKVAVDDTVYGTTNDSQNYSGSFNADLSPRAQYILPVAYGQFGISGDGAARMAIDGNMLTLQRNY